MGEPLPYDPEERPIPSAPPEIERADWLVGASEGMSDDDTPPTPPSIERPRLLRPESQAMESPWPPGRTPFPGRPAPPATPVAPPAPPPPPAPEMPKWDHGQNSVPMLRREAAGPTPSSDSIPELGRDFPMDDAEDRARVTAELAERRAEEDAVASRPHEVVDPREFEVPEPARGAAARPGALLADRRVYLALAALALVVLVLALWPREERTISVAHLKSHPERYADQAVRVGGKVGEVFPVGGSWAYSLVQGRDTIVVFTRTREPRLHEKVVVVGTLSTGYLDGVSRAAIFESTR